MFSSRVKTQLEETFYYTHNILSSDSCQLSSSSILFATKFKLSSLGSKTPREPRTRTTTQTSIPTPKKSSKGGLTELHTTTTKLFWWCFRGNSSFFGGNFYSTVLSLLTERRPPQKNLWTSLLLFRLLLFKVYLPLY